MEIKKYSLPDHDLELCQDYFKCFDNLKDKFEKELGIHIVNQHKTWN